MLIKEAKDGVNVGVLNLNVLPQNANGYTYSEITQEEYDAILAEFAARESE